MKILLKRLSLKNFKGIRKYEIYFSDGINEVIGENGTGKTSLFDAFLWLLFGKDSQGKKDFGIKTLDEDGNEIHRIEHNVTAVVEIEGREKTLSRTLREKWQTEKGKTEEVYKGNETVYEIDNVPLKMSEYNVRIAEWVDEEIFKLVTNPVSFVGLKTQQQREILMKMADIDDDISVAKKYGKEDIISIIESGKSVSDRAKELAKIKSKLKKEIELLPPRIDEVMQSISDSGRDIEDVESDISESKKCLYDLEKKIEIIKNGGGNIELENEIKKKETELEQARMEHNIKVKEIRSENDRMKSERIRNIEELNSKIASGERNIKELKNDISFAKERQNSLREEYKKVRSDVFPKFSDTVCPCCGRAWEKDMLESKQNEYEEKRKAHNEARAKRLAEINDKGIKLSETIKECEEKISGYSTKNELYKNQLEEFKNSPLKNIFVPVFDDKVYSDEISGLKEQLESNIVDTSKEEEKIKKIKNEIMEFETERGDIIAAQKAKERLSELEDDMKQKAQAIADIEREEEIIMDFTKIKIDILDKAVNDRFGIVKFKLYDYQINGGFTECCEPMINGVPYSDLNGAGKVNAGLDIINALQIFYDVKVPVFIDNKETVNSPLKLDCQTIYLKVVGEEKNKDVKVIEITKGVA